MSDVHTNILKFFWKIMKFYDNSKAQCHKLTGDHWDVFDKDFIELIEEEGSWKDFRRNGLTCMLETGLYSTDRKDFITNRKKYPQNYDEYEIPEIIGRYKELVEMAGENFVRDYAGPDIGEPRYYEFNGAKLNFDDLYHLYATWQITRTCDELSREPEWILEIGGGYGNLCQKLKKRYPKARYIMLDLPETLLVQNKYLSMANPDLKFFDITKNSNLSLEERIVNERFDVALVPGWMGDILKNIKFDLIINARSLGEMTEEAVEYYFDLVQARLKERGIFYCINRYAFVKSKHALKIRDFPFDDNWSFLISQPQWLQTHLHEWLAIREKPILSPKFLLKSFPLRTPPSGPIMENILPLKQWLKNEKEN
jgi:putative sugar O-methyltransferase